MLRDMTLLSQLRNKQLRKKKTICKTALSKKPLVLLLNLQSKLTNLSKRRMIRPNPLKSSTNSKLKLKPKNSAKNKKPNKPLLKQLKLKKTESVLNNTLLKKKLIGANMSTTSPTSSVNSFRSK